jgi:hypothetical protein
LDREIAGSEFKDARLRKRFGTLLEQLWRGMGQTIPLACQDWANTKAAYRFMDNDRVSKQDILSGHFQATAQRFRRPMDRFLYFRTPPRFRTKGNVPNSSVTLAAR